MHVSTPQSWRGGEQQVAYLATELRKLHQDQVLMVAKDSAMERFCADEGLVHHSAPKMSSMPFGFAQKLAHWAKHHEINLIHAHDSHAHTACIIAAVFFGLKVPIVLSRRVDFKVGKSWLSRFKYNHPQVKKILCVSGAIKKVMEQCVKRTERLEVVYSGVDTTKFPDKIPGILRAEYSIPNDIPLVGNVAALADHKDYFTFVDTVKLLVERKVKAAFFIIGDGPQREEIKTYVKAQGLEDKITFTGFRKNITDILTELDVLLFTSKMEGLGTTILDAWSAKVPVVATAGGGIPELVVHGETGLLCEIKNPQACAEHVMHLLTHPQERKAIIYAAQTKVQSFSKEVTAQKTLDVYQSVSALPH